MPLNQKKLLPDTERVIERLSRMTGNCHVRFLEEKGRAISLTYPTNAICKIGTYDWIFKPIVTFQYALLTFWIGSINITINRPFSNLYFITI